MTRTLMMGSRFSRASTAPEDRSPGDIQHGVGVLAPGLGLHVLDVDAGLAAGGGKGGDGVGHVPVDDAHPLGAGLPGHGEGGQVHGVYDVAVLQVVLELVYRHDRAVVLALRGGGAQVGDGDDVFQPQEAVVGEVGGVGRALAALQGGDEGGRVHQVAPGKVEDAHAVLHLPQGFGTHHALGVGGEGQVQGDVVAVLVDLIQGQGAVHPAGQVPGGFHGEEGVVAVDVHAQQAGGVGHQDADGPQAHHAQGLALDLGSGELALAFFHQLAYLVPLALQGLDPVHGGGDLPGRTGTGRRAPAP